MPTLNSFKVALALLTRLGTAHLVQDSSLAKSRTWFAAVGVILGFIYCSVVFTLHNLTLMSAWVLAWVYLSLDIWLTRALHYDGLADIGDALGSGKTGETFWIIVHDSRLGAFGAIALFMALAAQLFAIQDLIGKEQWYALIIAPVFGRILCVLFTNMVKAFNPQSLGGKICTPFSIKLFWGYLALSFILLSPLGLLSNFVIHSFGILLLFTFKHISLKHGGCNGDFLGTIIVTGQCLVLLIISTR